jgi:hypothetical protein
MDMSSDKFPSVCLACGKGDTPERPHKNCSFCPNAMYCSMYVCGGTGYRQLFVYGSAHWLHPLQGVPEGGLEGRAQGDLPQA